MGEEGLQFKFKNQIDPLSGGEGELEHIPRTYLL